MNLAGYDFLAGSVLARDQNVGVGWRGPLDQEAHALHRRRLAEKRRFGAVRKLGSTAPLHPRVDLASPQGRGAANRCREALITPRLSNEVARTSLDGLDRDRHRPMGCDNHDRGIRVFLHDPCKRLKPLAPVGRSALEIEIEQNRVGTLPFQERKQLSR